MYKRLIAIVLVLMMLLSVSACKKEAAPVATQPTQLAEPTVVGTWTADVDLTDELDSLLYAQLGSEHICTEFMLPLVLTLAEDGTYTVALNDAVLAERMESLGRTFWQFVVDQAAAKNHISEQEASETLKQQGKDHVTLLEELNLVSFFKNGYCNSGVWKQDGDALIFAKNEDALASAASYPIVLSETQLQLEYQTGVDDNDEPIASSVTWMRAE